MDQTLWVKPLGVDEIPSMMVCRVCRQAIPLYEIESHLCKEIKMDKLFTYGSLMSGEPNHPVLTRCKAKFLKSDTLEAIKLSTRYPFPAITEGLGLVKGEVYEIDRAGIIHLDSFEGHPDFYQRREVVTESGETVWAYFGTGVIGAGVKKVEAIPDPQANPSTPN